MLSSINAERCLLEIMWESGLYDSAFIFSGFFRKEGGRLIALRELRKSCL